MRPDRFDKHDIYYCKPIRNKIMNGGLFSRIIYSTSLVSINGIHIVFSLNGRIQEVYNNKYKFMYDNDAATKSVIESLEKIEYDILKNYAFQENKTIVFRLKDQLVSNFFKFFQSKINVNPTNDSNQPTTYSICPTSFSLKISGVWATETSYGITYKFTRV